jgi:signal transduction histidine kinase
MVAARTVARSDERTSQRAFAATSVDVAHHLRLAITHEEDLLVSTSAFIAANRQISNDQFDAWVRADRAFERYPEILAFERVEVVRASQLPAFAKRAMKGPAAALAADGSFQVTPPGKRPFYCFTDRSARERGANIPAQAGRDVCTGANAVTLIASQDSGLSTYEPLLLGKTKTLAINTPIYRDGAVPATVAARRATSIGWITMALTPKIILDDALAGLSHTNVTMHYRQGSSKATFTSGNAPTGAHSLTTDLHNGWTIQTSATVDGSSILSNPNALALLIGGTAVSVLLGLLGAVLATGRTRARRQVSEQTIELRNQAAELQLTVNELEAAQAIKDEFLGLVSHELRTPLTSIRGYTEMLKEEKLEDAQQSYLEVIDRNAGRLLSLVEDLLLMAQIQSGGLPLELGEVILNDLIARSSEEAQPFATSKQIALNIDTQPDIATQGDPVRLGQVLDNLVSNAIKYTPHHGGVSITMTRTGDTATIAVSDTGIGIPKDEQAQMFGRFFRTTNARDSGIEGTGLGLAITRGIVEAHGGTITFDSIEGAGTTFRITLPRAHDASPDSRHVGHARSSRADREGLPSKLQPEAGS